MKLTYFTILTVLFYPINAICGGFQLNENSQKALATGGATVAASYDASSLFYNPAGVSFLKNKYNFTGGTTLIFPSISLQTQAVENENQTSPIATPIHFYGVVKANEKLSIGISINNQFGSTASFRDNWEGKYLVQKLSLTTFMFQPTIAYKIMDRLSVGGGFVYTKGSFDSKQAIPVATANFTNGEAQLNGSGSAVSYNLGIKGILLPQDTARFIREVSIGASYRSEIALGLNNGVAQFSDISISLQDKFPSLTNFRANITLPRVYTIGAQIKFKPIKNFTIAAVLDWNRTNWSSYDSLKINFEKPETPDVSSPKKWKNVSTYRVGLIVGYKKKLVFRAGAYYDQSPIKDNYVSPELPDKNQVGITAGISYIINDYLSTDVSFLHSNMTRKETNNISGFNAEYRRMINVLGIGINITL